MPIGEKDPHSLKDHRSPEIPVGECMKLYKGTKSYWRTGESIDIAIFEHHAPGNVITKSSSYWIEIIAYNPTLDVEAPHLYIESMKLCDRFNEKAAKNQSQNFLFSMQDDVVPGQKVAQALYLKYIMNRLAIVHGDGDDTAIPEDKEAYASETPSQKKRDFAITLVPKGDETWSAKEPIFTLEKPLGLHVLPDLKHQRRGSGTPGEFENTVAHIRRDSVEIERSLMEAGHFEHVLSEEFKKKVVVPNTVSDRDHTTNPATAMREHPDAAHVVVHLPSIAHTEHPDGHPDAGNHAADGAHHESNHGRKSSSGSKTNAPGLPAINGSHPAGHPTTAQ